MQDYFENEIKRLEKEILFLKSSMKKNAGVIGLYRQYIELPMVLQDTGGVVPSNKTYIKINTNNINQLFFITFDKYYDDTLAPGKTEFGYYRQRYHQLRVLNGNLMIKAVALGTYADQATIEGGGTVSLPIKMTVYSTDEFTLEQV